MLGWLTDLRSGWRLLCRHRGTSLLIIATLALGFGANVSMFAMARGVLLRPLPYEDPDRLMFVWLGRSGPGAPVRGLMTPRFMREIQARQRAFSSLAAIELWDGNPSAAFDLAASGGAERLHGAFVTPDFFQTIGVEAAIGRVLAEGDSPDLAVVSHDAWQRLFGASADVLGRRIELATGRGKQRAVQPVTIVGVLPPRVQFSYPDSTDMWLLFGPQQSAAPLDAIAYRLVGRLRPDVTLQQAEQELVAAKQAIAADLKRNMDAFRFWLEPVHEHAVGAVRPAVLLIAAVAFLVFVVACLNVAVLLLAQTAERRRDTAIQVALGASRWRIIRQLFVESTLLAMAAATVSVTVVAALQPALRAAIPATFSRVREVAVDLATLGWMTALVTLGIVLSTVVPAWRSSDATSNEGMTTHGRASTHSHGAARWRHRLVATEVAIVVVMLVAGGLLLRSLWALQRVDLGFAGERVFTAEMRLLDPRYFDAARLKTFQTELLSRVRALPGVERASITSAVPLRGVDWTRVLTHRGERVVAKQREIDPDYFGVMGIPLLAGRGFSAADGEAAAPVVVISRALAARLFAAGQNPLGQRLDLAPKQQPEIVGVVGDIRNVRIDAEADPAYYLPRAQRSSELVCLVARTAPETPDLGPAVRAIVKSIDPMQPVFNATTIDRIASETIADRRFYAVGTASFALITLLLAAAGLVGVTSYGVIARTREIGIRIALGAAPARLARMLVAQSLRPVTIGLASGLIVAFWTGRLIERFLFDVQSLDPMTYAAVAGSIIVITVVACAVPSLRAARLNPTVALRHDG
jgi:putative ABC transport system permease protein